jgi:transmembrane sensor
MNAASADASRSSSRKARAEAAAWIVRLHGPNRTPSLEAALREWLAADAENRLQFQRVTEVWDDARGIPVGGITRVAYPSRGARKHSWGLAAVVLVACGIAALSAYRIWFANVYRTGLGEQRIVRLEDGSRVSLNSESRLELEFTGVRRHVTLTHGEAYFEVVHNSNRPFVVTVGEHDITDFGTSFLVRYDRDRTAVTLVEGKVTVSNAAMPGTARPESQGPSSSGEQAQSFGSAAARSADGRAKGGALQQQGAGGAGSSQIVTLSPGERLVFAGNAPPKLDSPHIDVVTAWRRGEVVLDRTLLDDAVTEMNRYEDEKLVIDSPNIGRLPISGIYRVGDSMGFAQTIARLYGLQIKQENKQIRITGKVPVVDGIGFRP